MRIALSSRSIPRPRLFGYGLMRTLIPLLLTVIKFASVSVAQSTKDKIEIGVQSTSLTLFHPDFPFDDTQGRVGGRVTYNFNRSIAAEAEINFFPQKQF